ncbi:MAG: hypothetical protein IPP88_13375 [Betaproteobacteria bacterium]|nr:hypothetical protein [Betaproteobacteria bacterium]
MALLLAMRYAEQRRLPESRVKAASETWFDGGGNPRRLTENALIGYLDSRFPS